MSHSLGYNPAHIFAVEEAYGGPHGLKTLVKEAHARGIAVILDVVYNHLGPSDLDLWQFDGWSVDGKGGFSSSKANASRRRGGARPPTTGAARGRAYLAAKGGMWREESPT